MPVPLLKLAVRCFILGSACAALWGQLAVAAEPPAPKEPSVRIVHAPADSFVPDVAVDAAGVLHMVYAQNRNAFYVRSADNGETFTRPVQVNSEGTVAFTMGERGPKLSVGDDGVIHVVWMDCWAPGVKTYVQYSRSTDGGKSFEKRKALSSMNGGDGVTMAADGAGHVMAFWHVNVPPPTEIPQATWLHLARSDDNGATFKADERVEIANLGARACSMCMMRARFGKDRNVFLAFRTAENNIRDFYVLKAAPTDKQFTATRVNEDNWNIKTCPMCGPELTLGPEGRQLCAFMTRNKVYWAVSDEGVTKFRQHVATPANEEGEIYPTAVANRRGDVLFVWQVGPMSTTGKATVKWARYTQEGKFTGQQATLGVTTSGTKPTACVGRDDNFYIVTTAR